MRFYFGHHKCASTYLHRFILLQVCARLKLKRCVVSLPGQFGGDLNQFVRDHEYDLICYINADRSFIDGLDMRFAAVHVVRDPRDILVSAYFSHLHSHLTTAWPELFEFRKKLQTLSIKEGLLAELEFITDLPTNGYALRPFQNMMRWDYDDPRILELRFEDMVDSPVSFFRRFGRHLELINRQSFLSRFTRRRAHHVLSESEFLDIVARNSFAKLAGRSRGKEEQTHHYRKGEPGDWRQYFDEDITREFKERFPGLLAKLGYEKSDDWRPTPAHHP